MTTYLAYAVACKESYDERKRKNEWRTSMIYKFWIEALTLFLIDRDIQFEIDKDLVNTPLSELSQQDHLCNS